MKEPSVPPATARSPRANVVEGLERVTVTVEFCPMPMLEGLAERVAVGAVVSTLIGVASAPARFWLALASAKAPAATEMSPGAVELAVGVKIAV